MTTNIGMEIEKEEVKVRDLLDNIRDYFHKRTDENVKIEIDDKREDAYLISIIPRGNGLYIDLPCYLNIPKNKILSYQVKRTK